MRRRHTAVLLFDFVINTLLTVIELIAAVISGSVALKGDSFQNLTDSLVLTVAYVGERAAARPSLSKRQTANIYRRASLVNATILVTLSLYTGYAAILRTLAPQPVNGVLVIVIGMVSVVVNLVAAGALYVYRNDRTTEAPYMGLLFSGLSGFAVCLSGIGATYWHVQRIDGIMGALIACLLLTRATRMIINAARRSSTAFLPRIPAKYS